MSSICVKLVSHLLLGILNALARSLLSFEDLNVELPSNSGAYFEAGSKAAKYSLKYYNLEKNRKLVGWEYQSHNDTID